MDQKAWGGGHLAVGRFTGGGRGSRRPRRVCRKMRRSRGKRKFAVEADACAAELSYFASYWLRQGAPKVLTKYAANHVASIASLAPRRNTVAPVLVFSLLLTSRLSSA